MLSKRHSTHSLLVRGERFTLPHRLHLSYARCLYRACVGRNVAVVELQVIIASLLRRYQFVLEQPGQMVSSAREPKTENLCA